MMLKKNVLSRYRLEDDNVLKDLKKNFRDGSAKDKDRM